MLSLFDDLEDTEEVTTTTEPEAADCSCPMAGVVTDIDCPLHGERGKTTELVTIPERPAKEPELIMEPAPPEIEPEPEPEPEPRRPASATVRELKDADEDFEWYPTTDEIIQTVCKDMQDEHQGRRYNYDIEHGSIMDIGAGDGRVLVAMREAVKGAHNSPDLYAIEKAVTHLSNMPKEIIVVGTDLMEQSLIDKPVQVAFCNPPYSEYDAWMRKVIRESTASNIYFVVPTRWRDRKDIECVIADRGFDVTSLGEFDFENADRQARAKVEIVRVHHPRKGAFDSVVDNMLPELDVFNKSEELETEPERTNEVAEGDENIVQRLVKAYDADMTGMIANYRAACSIDREVLRQLGIQKETITEGIKGAVKSLKDKYWRVLFENMEEVTGRLATKQRSAFLDSIQSKMTIDFTENNIYSFLIWVSKWANDFYDEQLIDLFQTLSNDSNAVKYKSNDRIWTQSDWYYSRREDENGASHYRLEYRMVVSHGGINSSDWTWERNQYKGLTEHAFNLLRDIVTVANNLGFECSDSPGNYEWESNTQRKLMMDNGKPLAAVRAFKNGNMHIHFDPSVMLAINVEAGRLLGWIRNPAQAADEFEASPKDRKAIEGIFGSSFRIGTDAGLKIGMAEAS